MILYAPAAMETLAFLAAAAAAVQVNGKGFHDSFAFTRGWLAI